MISTAEWGSAMSQYRLAFDVSTDGYQTWRSALFPAGMLLVSLITLIVLRSTGSIDDKGNRRHRAIAGLVGAASALICVLMLRSTWSAYDTLRTSLRNGAFQVVEGRVVDFVPQDPGGHTPERFRVGDVRFEYSETYITSAFHQIAAKGGPIHPGVTVRIADVDGAIARLEILQ